MLLEDLPNGLTVCVIELSTFELATAAVSEKRAHPFEIQNFPVEAEERVYLDPGLLGLAPQQIALLHPLQKSAHAHLNLFQGPFSTIPLAQAFKNLYVYVEIQELSPQI